MPLVKLYAGLRAAAGVKEAQVEGTLLRDILNVLVEQYPGLDGAVLQNGALRPHVVVTVNGTHIPDNQGLDIFIASEDQIAIFPPIAGG